MEGGTQRRKVYAVCRSTDSAVSRLSCLANEDKLIMLNLDQIKVDGYGVGVTA